MLVVLETTVSLSFFVDVIEYLGKSNSGENMFIYPTIA